MRRVAVVGAGISGLGAAHALAPECRVTLFEAASHFGGHAHTVDVTLQGVRHGVDTGFLVFNHRTYPQLTRLFAELGVETAPSEMSFSVQVPQHGLEWSGANLAGVFAQKRNLLSPAFLRMLADLLRFNRLASALADRGPGRELDMPLGAFLDRHAFGTAFREGYLLPMIGCIWSCPTDQMLQFPLATLLRFCRNHGLLQLADRPQWHTVRGGSRNYVQRLLGAVDERRPATPVRRVRRLPPADGAAGVIVETDAGSERFDDVVLACHTDQILQLLPDADARERVVLGSIRYRRNLAVLHTDETLLPHHRAAWAAWNYERAPSDDRERAGVCLHYLINRLQPLPWSTPVIVSLNPVRPPRDDRVLGEYPVDHPVFDGAAMAAQRELTSIQGRSSLWFCGAWAGYGFHEDGLASGRTVAGMMTAAWRREGAHREAA